MKKQIVIAAAAAVFLSSAGFAEAGDRDRGYRSGNNYGYSSSRHHNPRGHHGNRYTRTRHHSVRHYNSYYRGNRYGHYKRHHDHYDGLKIVAGAAILGSLIYAINDNRRESVVYRTTRPVTNSNLHYQLDQDGQCVEVSSNRQGQEVWTYVNASYCY